VVPVVGVDAPTEAYTLSPGHPISVPVSGSIPVPKRLSSASHRGLESPPTVSDHVVLTIVDFSLLITRHFI
jgi:hypothetical protein